MRRRAAVVGGGFGGLAAAGVLARAGCDVTLFEADPVLGGKAQHVVHDGVRLDGGPTLLALPDVVRATFDALGAGDLLPPLHELDLQCAYTFADGCAFTAWRDVERMAASADALAPGEGAGLRAFYAEAAAIWDAAGAPYLEAPFEGVGPFLARVARRGPRAVVRGMAMGSLGQLVRRHFRHPGLRQYAGRFATYVGGAPDMVSAAFALIPHVEQSHGVWHVEGGMGALVDALEAAVRRLGVTIVTGARATWSAHRGGFVVGPPGDAIGAETLVLNADPLPPDAAGPLALSGYVLQLAVPRRLALAHHAVWFGADYDREFAQLFSGTPPDDPTIYACHPVATDPTMAPADRSGLFVMTNAPTLPRGPVPARWPHADRVRAQCLARLEAAVPGLAGDATVVGERTPVDFARQGAPRGSLYGYLPRGRFGAFRRPRMRGTPPGVFFAGGGTHPGGGVPMVLLSGRFAAGMALRHLGMREAA